MTDNNRRDGGGFLAATLIGALCGAAAVFFLNEDTREKARKKINQAVSSGEDEVARLKREVIKLKADLKKRAAQNLKKANQKLSS
jgi:gas vesicle protein